MSYDIQFMVKVEGVDRWLDACECFANITWNVGEMIRVSTGLEWKNEADNGLVKDIVPAIEKGKKNLILHPERYIQYESPNGWGTIGGTIRFFDEILRTWYALRERDSELAEVVHFWIT